VRIDEPEKYPTLFKDIFDEQTYQKLHAESISPENKNAVKEEAQALVEEDGAFGMPWFHVEYKGKVHKFFGSDRFEVMAHTCVIPPYILIALLNIRTGLINRGMAR
jgi:glutathione S-transferase kappa 1